MRSRQMLVIFLLSAFTASAGSAANATPPAQTSPSADQAAKAEGSYTLEDGRRLRLSTQANRLVGEVDGERRTLMATGERSFASTDGTLTVEFVEGRDDNVVRVSITPQFRKTGRRSSRFRW